MGGLSRGAAPSGWRRPQPGREAGRCRPGAPGSLDDMPPTTAVPVARDLRGTPPTTVVPVPVIPVPPPPGVPAGGPDQESPDSESRPTFGARRRQRKARRPQWAQSRRTVRHLNVWTVAKVSLAFYFMFLVAVVIASVLLWYIADAFGSIDSIEKSVKTLFDLKSFTIHPRSVAIYTSIGGGVLAVCGTLRQHPGRPDVQPHQRPGRRCPFRRGGRRQVTRRPGGSGLGSRRPGAGSCRLTNSVAGL